MAHGKDAALDMRWGRQGGRRTTAGSHLIDELDRVRARSIAGGTWPDGTPKGDRDCTKCGDPISTHTDPPCSYCGRPPQHHADGDLAAERAGKLRMAQARAAAGSDLNQLDHELLAQAAAA